MSGMKGESLFSSLSNLSYHCDGGQYGGSDFFKQSLQVKFNKKHPKCKEREQIGIDSIAMSAAANFNGNGESVGAFTLCWTNDGKNAFEGISDEQAQPEQNERIPIPNIEQQKAYCAPIVPEESSNSPIQKASKSKNETKNIPKNYGKAIIIFMEKNFEKLQPIFTHYQVDYDHLIEQLQGQKKAINTIADLRKLWMEFKHCEVMRVVSLLFLRKYSLPYIFNSRIKSRQCHVKYKRRLQEALSNPSQFQHIKDY